MGEMKVLGSVVCAMLAGLGSAATSQMPQVAPEPDSQVTPGAAYQEAMRPVEVTRRSIANWSETEQGALAVAMHKGMAACAARNAEDYAGEALVDLGHLCALGQAWPGVVVAADRYLEEKDATKPLLGDAYASKLDAQLRMKDEAGALKTAREMLGAVAYTSQVADATNEALNYMELLYTMDAVALAEERLATVLELMRGSSGAVAGGAKGSNAVPRPAELYRQALIVAELEQLANEPEIAKSTYAKANEAVPMDVAGDDLIAIKGMRRRYEMLGKPLGKLEPIVSLDVVKRLPTLPASNAITALLLFPDWCAQCVRMARHMPESVFQVAGHEAYMYGLLAQTMPAAKLPAGSKDGGLQEKFVAAYAAEYLRETPTVTVDPALLETFDATEVPLLIVVDGHGIVRLIEGVDEDALQPGKTVDSAIALVGRQWPTVVKRTAGKTENHR